ncbi:spore germination protein [Paenibacillus thalictri]|uniref:Spore germination protein n=1 Tax=Paenibacillus thalictri TaxID=2527873 RepID=A0A4Q9DV67_9BACL|nr:spore germination protein [Paenibacillus thalictri]TBL78690.1 spore germination protein [Paenibacillus thalictri]
MIKIHRKHKRKQQEEQKQHSLENFDYRFISELKDVPIFLTLEENKNYLEKLFEECYDFVVREFTIQDGAKAMLIMIDGLVNTELIHDALKAIMISEGHEQFVDNLALHSLPVTQMKQVNNYSDLLLAVLSGDPGLLIESNNKALIIGVRGYEKRSINMPETESVIRGPKEGFVESLCTNTSLVRRKLKTPRLKMKYMTIGSESNTSVVVSYLDGIATQTMVDEVVSRLEKIKIDAVLESGYIEEFIQDNTYSPFPQVQNTERPDVVAAGLLQGRVAIMVDGTPFALIVPFLFIESMQANEDYFERFQISSLVRILRYLFMLLSLTTPALYVAMTTYHQELLPTTLLLSIAAARENIPFPAVIEALILEITFEALREAGIRLPRAVGSAVSILGALVVGQAAVEAGIVSAPMVIVVSITGIASFTIPRFNGAIAIRMLRFPILIAASLFGLYGMLLTLLVILGHMANLRSFGVPYLSPLAPFSWTDAKDSYVRAPWWAMGNRPAAMPMKDEERVGRRIAEQISQYGGQKGNLTVNGNDGQDQNHPGGQSGQNDQSNPQGAESSDSDDSTKKGDPL